MRNLTEVAVVMLAWGKDQQAIDMTQNAINTLHNSEKNFEFRVLVVETGKHLYDNAGTICVNEQPFNYNKFLNIGFERMSDAPYVVVANNDVVFHEGWFTKIAKAMKYNNLDSASPLCPGWFQHAGLTEEIYPGWNVGREFCGWLLVYRRDSLDKLLPFDEQFEFWCQDNDLAITQAKMGMRHALVTKSHVTHLTSQSHRLVDGGTMQHYTNGMAERFHKKHG